MKRRRVHVWVSGRVQGVFFRAATRDQARALGVLGWVRNLPDGGVEIVAEGDGLNIEAFLDWCRRGPPRAVVESIEVLEESPEGRFESFEVRRDY
jgi:acylphosphatase